MSQLLTKSDIYTLLNKRFEEDKYKKLSDIPHPSSFKDIKKATKRIKEAIDQKEKIVIVGDYDVDGVVSSVILKEFFDDINVSTKLKIPNRFADGYGINKNLLKTIDADLIITVDNGISAVEAAEVCKQKGVDLIITDHHTAPEVLPDAYAIINPKQEECNFPHSEICGAQVAWYLVAALKDELGIKYDLSKFLDILAMAIVADMMELKDLNRTMVKSGFLKINKSQRPFFQAIKRLYKKTFFKSEDLSFLLSPLINSAGRIEDATLAYELIRAKSVEEAIDKLSYIIDLNNERKEIERDITKQAMLQHDHDKKITIAWGENWHEGVIGIVAARLVQKFKKPAIVFSINGDIAKGSARSIGNIHLLDIVRTQEVLLSGFGGHKGAAGMSIKSKNLEEFKKNLEEIAQSIDPKDFIEKVEVLGEIDPCSIDFELLDILEYFQPYGQKNPEPKFLLKNAFVKIDKIIGKERNHQKLILELNRCSLESLFFNFDQEARQGDSVDIVFSVSKNEFRGNITPQLLIKDISIR
jgi:single-stranded-DNA-specific exonuclease